MEFRINRNDFFKGLQRVQSISTTRGTMPILANILIKASGEKVSIFATNLEIGLKGEYEAQVVEEGAITVSAKKVHDIVRELPTGEILVKESDGRLRLSYGNSRFNLATLPSADYPSFLDFKESNFIKLKSKLLADMIRKTSYAISKDETRRTLTGALLEIDPKSTKMVATDGHRLGLVERAGSFKVTDNIKIIVARKAIEELSKLILESDGDIEFLAHDNYIIFKIENQYMSAKLIEGAFPNYDQVIPKEHTAEVNISKEAFYYTLRRVSTLADEKSHMVKLTFHNDKLSFMSEGGGIGEARDELEIKYSGERIEIGLNSNYLLDLLNAIDGDEVKIKISDLLGPLLIESESDEKSIGIIMPMRL
ncbi:MAG: DNA polymerase III subunit beta [Nitrospinota bacterium]